MSGSQDNMERFGSGAIATVPSRAETADPPPEAPAIAVDNVSLGYQPGGRVHHVIEDFSLTIEAGEQVMLIGPSGCGKSTVLKAIAGFVPALSGAIYVRGKPATRPGPDRTVVFQEHNQLFPWLTAARNVEAALRAVGRKKKASAETARHFLGLMGLEKSADRYPHQLSGGMKQRVSIARALALEPDILLMDEPFGALDAITRLRLQQELRTIMSSSDATLLFVTHSIDEAILLGDRVVVMGGIEEPIRACIDVAHLDSSPGQEAEYGRIHGELRDLLIHQ